jgi:hypothetical protein
MTSTEHAVTVTSPFWHGNEPHVHWLTVPSERRDSQQYGWLLPHEAPIIVPELSSEQMQRLGDSLQAQLLHWHVVTGVDGQPA